MNFVDVMESVAPIAHMEEQSDRQTADREAKELIHCCRPFEEVPFHSRMAPAFAGRLCHRCAPEMEQDYGWRMDQRAGALPILFMLAAETEAAVLQFCCCLKTRKSTVEGRWIRIDALGDFRLISALTKLSSKRAENPIHHGPDNFSCESRINQNDARVN